MDKQPTFTYSKREEQLNVITHAFGLVASIILCPFLVLKALEYSGFWQPFSFILFGISMVLLFAASTSYHAAKHPKKRKQLNILDHAAIYVLIAGSYTPYCLVALNSKLGFYMFGFVWIFALIGIVLKLFFTGRFKLISTGMYLLMGWQVVFFIKPLMAALSPLSLNLLFLGGLFYTIGAILYSIKKVPYNHAIFHVFVLLGCCAHVCSIFLI